MVGRNLDNLNLDMCMELLEQTSLRANPDMYMTSWALRHLLRLSASVPGDRTISQIFVCMNPAPTWYSSRPRVEIKPSRSTYDASGGEMHHTEGTGAGFILES